MTSSVLQFNKFLMNCSSMSHTWICINNPIARRHLPRRFLSCSQKISKHLFVVLEKLSSFLIIFKKPFSNKHQTNFWTFYVFENSESLFENETKQPLVFVTILSRYRLTLARVYIKTFLENNAYHRFAPKHLFQKCLLVPL